MEPKRPGRANARVRFRLRSEAGNHPLPNLHCFRDADLRRASRNSESSFRNLASELENARSPSRSRARWFAKNSALFPSIIQSGSAQPHRIFVEVLNDGASSIPAIRYRREESNARLPFTVQPFDPPPPRSKTASAARRLPENPRLLGEDKRQGRGCERNIVVPRETTASGSPTAATFGGTRAARRDWDLQHQPHFVFQ